MSRSCVSSPGQAVGLGFLTNNQASEVVTFRDALDGVIQAVDITTYTPTNDRVEALALKRVFGDGAAHVPMSSIKSMLGHTMGAAGAIEAAACALALYRGVIPPTMNYEEPDPECEVDCVPNEARETKPRIALNNAYAFGGNNASLCLGRAEVA